MKDNRFKKGEYEDAVEQAKNLLNDNFGMSDIMSITNLSKDEVRKIIKKRDAELNDKHPNLY